jgi:hypothetical protein
LFRYFQDDGADEVTTETVESDIHRLTPLILSWPPVFPILNTVRNFVQHFCLEFYFKYTGWPDLEMSKFRLYMHFNTTKYAFQAGKFMLEENPDAWAVDRAGKRRDGKGGEREVKVEREKEEGSMGSEDTVVELVLERIKVSTAPYGMRSARSFDARSPNSTKPSSTVISSTNIINDITPQATISIDMALNPFDQLKERLARIEGKVEEIGFKPKVEEGPFKISLVSQHEECSADSLVQDLLAELSRAFILKAAFD